MSRNLHQEISARILAALKNGVIPWQQPWSSQGMGGMPKNAVTGRAYSGANVPLLWLTSQERGYTVPHFLTFKQAQEAGGTVRKGEKGTTVVFVSAIEKTDEKTGKPVRIPFLKAFTVFNVAQCDGLPEKLTPAPVAINPDAREELADAFIAATGAIITHGEARAYYSRNNDRINLPAFESFKTGAAYYSTAFHELTHWTGAPHRLDRVKGKKFGDNEYSFEELCAELGAAFCCAEFGFDNETEHDAAAYISHWIQFLEKHETAFVAAASCASKAVEFMRGLALADDISEAA